MTGRQHGTSVDAAPAKSADHLTIAGLIAVLLLSALIATVPGSSAALLARVTNTTNTARAAPYFTCAAAVTAAAPTIWYRLDETSGVTVTDSSGNGRNGRYRGTPTYGTATACPRDTGTAVTLDGSSAYLGYATAITVTGTFTLETWFRTTTTRGGRLIGFGTSATGASTTTDRQVYMVNSGQVVYGINPTSHKTVTSPEAYNDGVWHHLMATQSATTMNLYVDGALAAAGAGVVTSTTYSGFLRLGYDNLTGWPSAPTSSFFAGSLDQAATYSKTLTAADALEHDATGS